VQVLNHLPSPPDSANLLKNHISKMVHTLLPVGQENLTRDTWITTRKKWLEIYRSCFPAELFEMRNQPVRSKLLKRHQRESYRIETVIFESLWGWEVNAHLCIPDGQGPFPAVIFPTGHSGKTNSHYQLPPVLFALNGFLAITFDSPGQGEKSPGSDHFNQGIACTLTGLWSETFFLMDAMRAIDYLASREDVNMAFGVGMSGVSGGGQTTMGCACLDDRIRCIAPVCSTGNQRILAAENFYTSCPETLGKGLFKAGIDLAEVLACAIPTPCLAVSGELDEIYTPDVVNDFVEQVRKYYQLAGAPERFDHYQEKNIGHAYTLTMAEKVLSWMQKWLIGEEKPIYTINEPAAYLEKPEIISCSPQTTRTMHSINLERADQLRKGWQKEDIAIRLREVLNLPEICPPTVQVLAGETAWWHRIDRLAIACEPEIPLPALWMVNTRNKLPAKTIVWIDDRGKWEAIQKEPWLVTAAGFLNESIAPEQTFHLCLLDARGWGETAPEHLAFDLAWWNDIHRILAYISIALDYPLMGQRVNDVLTTLFYLRQRTDVDPNRIILGGRGAGAIAALLSAVIDSSISGVILTEMPLSYREIIEHEDFIWSHDIFIPNLLLDFDLPELIAALNCPVLNIHPLDRKKAPISQPAQSIPSWLGELRL